MMMVVLVTVVEEMSTFNSGRMGGDKTKATKTMAVSVCVRMMIKAKRMGQRQSASNKKIFRKFNDQGTHTHYTYSYKMLNFHFHIANVCCYSVFFFICACVCRPNVIFCLILCIQFSSQLKRGTAQSQSGLFRFDSNAELNASFPLLYATHFLGQCIPFVYALIFFLIRDSVHFCKYLLDTWPSSEHIGSLVLALLYVYAI